MYKIRLQRDFFETCNKVIRPFCWHQHFVPWGLSVPARGYIHVLNHEGNYIKSGLKNIFLKLVTNEWSDKTFLFTSTFCPLGTVCPCPGAMYMYKIMKKIYKIRLQGDFIETCNKWPKWQYVIVDIKISSPRGLSAPALGLNTCIKSWKKLYKIRL